ncbi:MAG: 23S rRNA (guanosine(2251)-2'-O)-methyltransferase RlmB [Cyanobacteriota bacterium]
MHTKKGRDKTNAFLLEGLKSIKEALKDNLKIKLLAVKENYEVDVDIEKKAEKFYRFSEQAFKKICATETPGNIVAACEKVYFNLEDILNKPDKNKLLVFLEEIRDPGNLGTIIRTCNAAQVSGIILSKNSTDIYNPKVVRASTGCLWKTPIIRSHNKIELLNRLKSSGFKVISSDMQGQKSYYSTELNKNIVIIFGNEGYGISEELKNLCDEIINIPISEKVESLNVGISVAIILFEARKQIDTQ